MCHGFFWFGGKNGGKNRREASAFPRYLLSSEATQTVSRTLRLVRFPTGPLDIHSSRWIKGKELRVLCLGSRHRDLEAQERAEPKSASRRIALLSVLPRTACAPNESVSLR